MAGLLEALKAKLSSGTHTATGPAPTKTKGDAAQASPETLMGKVLAMWEPMPMMIGTGVIVLVVAGGAALFSRGTDAAGATAEPSMAGAATPGAAAPAKPTVISPEAEAQAVARSKPVSAWISELGDKGAEPKVRWSAAQALGRVGKGHDEVEDIVMALSGVVRDDKEHFMVRTDAAHALGAIGPEAMDAIPVLKSVHSADKASAIRAAALAAANKIKPGSIAAPPAPASATPTKR